MPDYTEITQSGLIINTLEDPSRLDQITVGENEIILVPDDTDDKLAGKVDHFDTMPTASSANEGLIVQYAGTTTSTYTNGYFYKCVSDGAASPTYSWEQVDVQPAAVTPTEPRILLGTDSEGDQTLYTEGKGVVLNCPILPEGYTEVEYIKNSGDAVEFGEKTLIVVLQINNYRTLISKVREADTTVGSAVDSLKFTWEGLYNGTTNTFNVYGVVNGTETLLYQEMAEEDVETNYGIGIVQTGNWSLHDYFTIERTSVAGYQYIDTGVVFDNEYVYNEEASQLVDDLTVTVNVTNALRRYLSPDISTKIIFFMNGSEQNVKIKNQYSAMTYSSVDMFFREMGITIEGNITYGSSSTSENGTILVMDTIPYEGTVQTEVKADNLTEYTYAYPFGAKSYTGNFGVDLCSYKGGVSYLNWYARSFASFIPTTDLWQKINYSINKSHQITLSIDGSSTYTNDSSLYFPEPLYLFARNIESGHEIEYSDTMAMKRTTIMKNQVVAFDGVPCVRNSDNVPGMYDLVSGTFKPSTSDEPFIAGNPVVRSSLEVETEEVKSSDSVEIVRGFENDEYVQLEWLSSNGSSAVDLGFTPNKDDYYEVKFKMDTGTSSISAIYGNCSSNASQFPVCSLRAYGSSPVYWANLAWTDPGTNLGTTKDICVLDYNWHTFKVTPNQIFIDGKAQFMHTTSTTVNLAHMGLFGAFTGMSNNYDEWTLQPGFMGKIEYFRVLRRNNQYMEVVYRNFIMVRRKSDGVVGVYDTVMGTFHENQGTKDFIAGEPFGVRAVVKNRPNEFLLVGSTSSSGNTIDANADQYKTIATKNSTLYGVGTGISGTNTNNATLVGCNAVAKGGDSTAIGYNANSSGHATAVGANASANATNATAYGYKALVAAAGGIAIGFQAEAANGIAIGSNTKSSGHSIYIGTVISNGSDSVVIGAGNTSSSGGNGAITIGRNANCGAEGVAIGYNVTNQSGDYSIALGGRAWSTGTRNVAIGYNSGSSNGTSSYTISGGIALGNEARTYANYSTAIGYSASSSESYAMAIGYGSSATGYSSVALGTTSTTSGQYPIAIGCDSRAMAERAIAIGPSAYANAICAIQLGRGSNNSAKTFNVGYLEGENYQMLDSSGIIPYQRLAMASPTDQYVLTYDSGTDALTWTAGGGGGGGGEYTLPTATATRLGGVKVGNGLAVKNDGTLSVLNDAGGGFGASFDGGAAYSSYLNSQIIEGGAANTTYTSSQVINGGRANM